MMLRQQYVFWLKTSLFYGVRERGPFAVTSLQGSDFDVRLSGLSSGTQGHHSLTDFGASPSSPAAQIDPVSLLVKSN